VRLAVSRNGRRRARLLPYRHCAGCAREAYYREVLLLLVMDTQDRRSRRTDFCPPTSSWKSAMRSAHKGRGTDREALMP
jgi:hypothetical protein